MKKHELETLLDGYDALTKGEMVDAIDILSSLIPVEYLDENRNVADFIAPADRSVRAEDVFSGYWLGYPIKGSFKYGLKVGNGGVITPHWGASSATGVLDFAGNYFRYSDAVSGEIIGLWRRGQQVSVELKILTKGIDVKTAILSAEHVIGIPF